MLAYRLILPSQSKERNPLAVVLLVFLFHFLLFISIF